MLVHTTTSQPPDALETRRSFPVDEQGLVWTVAKGALEIFAIESPDGADTALQPLVQIKAGQAVFGLPSARGSGVTLVAKRAPNSQIVARQFESFADFDRMKASGIDGPALLQEWVTTLTRAIAGSLVPKNAELVEVGQHVTVEEAASVVSSRSGLVWVKQIAGTSRILGQDEGVIGADGPPYPLSAAGWIVAQPESDLAILDTDAVREDGGWTGLDAFHTHALSCIERQVRATREHERDRLRERAGVDERALQAALHDLASPLMGQQAGMAAGVEHAGETPLVRACQAIGQTRGLTMKPHPDMVRGLPVKNPVAAIAQASGIRYRRVALKDDWWKEGSEPLLVFRNDDNHPLALLPRRGGRGYTVVDPSGSETERLGPQTAAALNPFGYMFYRPFPQKALTPRLLLAFGLQGNGRDLVTIVLMSIAAGLLSMVMPFVTGHVFDALIPAARRSELLMLSALVVVATVATGMFNLARGFAVLRLQGKLSAVLQAGLWDRLLSLPVPFFRDYAAGDLASRSMAFSQIRTMLTGATLSAVLSGVSSIFSFGLLFYYSPTLALIATALTLVAVGVTVLAGAFELGLQRTIFKNAGKIAGIVVEFISGIAKFRVAGIERRAFVLWVQDFARQKRTDFSARRITNLLTVFNSVYVVICLAVLFYANSGFDSSRASALTTGNFLAFIAAFSQFMGAALALSGAVVGVMNIVPLYERAAPILKTLPEVTAAQISPTELTGDVEAAHLTFRYRPDAPLVLRDVSFHIKPGEYVAFVGTSGCGKSTLFRLLLGFEAAASGAIYYDGQELSGVDVEAVRRQIGVVLQSGTLVSGSIKDNICGSAWMSADDVWEAIRLAGLEDDIKAMPMSVHTMVQAGGGGLSGGQRQRVLIARAIVGKPRILLFDEATSALDNRTQAIVSNSLKSIKATRVVIAHRLSTILEADRIFVLDQGSIVQTGTYAELMRQPGLFRELASRQLTEQEA